MRRRDFITLLGGAAALPLAARAQQPGRIQRIGVLSGYDDPAMKAFQQELERLGWSEGRNVHIEYRYAPAGTQLQPLAQELVALQPDVIFAQSRPVVAALQAESHTIPMCSPRSSTPSARASSRAWPGQAAICRLYGL
jgi:putative tryptophan/tyrosine transport system substrate-binding protein